MVSTREKKSEQRKFFDLDTLHRKEIKEKLSELSQDTEYMFLQGGNIMPGTEKL